MNDLYAHITSMDKNEFTRKFDTDEKCLQFIIAELYGGEVRSPFCDSKVYPMKEFGRYKCAKTRNSFYITTGTIFYRSHIPLHTWFAILYHFANSRAKCTPTLLMRAFPESVKTMKTAIYVLKRIAQACQSPTKSTFPTAQVDTAPVVGLTGR